MSDYPDFHRLTSKIFGYGKMETGMKVAATIGTYDLVRIETRGTTLGGFITSFLSTAQIGDKPILYIDDILIQDWPYALLGALSMRPLTFQPIMITKYDYANFLFSCIVKEGLTFKTSIELKFYNSTDVSKNVYYAIQYTEL